MLRLRLRLNGGFNHEGDELALQVVLHNETLITGNIVGADFVIRVKEKPRNDLSVRWLFAIYDLLGIDRRTTLAAEERALE
jgi:hypothetical protein